MNKKYAVGFVLVVTEIDVNAGTVALSMACGVKYDTVFTTPTPRLKTNTLADDAEPIVYVEITVPLSVPSAIFEIFLVAYAVVPETMFVFGITSVHPAGVGAFAGAVLLPRAAVDSTTIKSPAFTPAGIVTDVVLNEEDDATR